jgi:hypothetical protein
VAGATASYAIWEARTLTGEGLPDLSAADSALPVCFRSVVAGAVAFDAEDPT